MNCAERNRHDLVAYIRAELDSAEMAAVEAHLSTCADCREEAVQFEAVLRSVSERCKIEPSPAFVADVLEAARAESREFQEAEAGSGRYEEIGPEALESLGWVDRIALRVRLFIGSLPTWGLATSTYLAIFMVLTLIVFGPALDDKSESGRLRFAPADATSQFEPSPWAHHVTQPGQVSYRPTLMPADPWSCLKNDKWLAATMRLRSDAVERERRRKSNGGDDEDLRAVQAGLKWLAGSQVAGSGPDSGSWSPTAHGGMADYRVAVSGLAALAFLGEGNTHSDGEYKAAVAAAVDYFLRVQQHDGLIGPREISISAGAPAPAADGDAQDMRKVRYMYNHAIATTALIEDFCLTRDDRLARPIEAAVNFILRAQTPAGGWGYTLTANSCDAIVTTWQVMALRLALGLGMKETAGALRRADAWLVCITNDRGEVGYAALNHFPNGPQTLTAMSLCAEYLMGRGGSDPISAAGVESLATTLPSEDAFSDPLAIDMSHLWFGSLVMAQNRRDGDSPWAEWNARVKKGLLGLQGAQRPGGQPGGAGPGGTQPGGAGLDEAGRWSRCDRWSSFGGSVYTTSLAILTLQVPYRYPGN
ncbi:MAG: zf-HC2 domain-containing protein [Planctomycetota bacterium]|nr:zf-HC2 domain-containing protein [Planctomycetota bacterium]